MGYWSGLKWKNNGNDRIYSWIGYDATVWKNSVPSAVYNANSELILYSIGYAPSLVGAQVDYGEDQSVIVHEYAHAIHDAIVDYSNLTLSYDGSAISEGMGNYIGISFRRTYQTSVYTQPNNTSNWASPGVVGIKSPSEAKYPDHWVGYGNNTHQDGFIWASALMDMEYNTGTNPNSGANLGRDKTMKLLLESLHNVKKESPISDYVNALLQADRDLYGGADLQNIENILRNRGLFNTPQTTISGIIENDTTLSGNLLVNSNITINTGVSVYIVPGTVLNFNNGVSLIVNGNLTANGSSTNKIYFNFTSKTGKIQFNQNSTGSVKYAVIDNANTGIFVERALPTIQNCEIKNCNYGIVLNNNNYVSGSINISSNNIHNNVYKGISFTLSGGNVYSNTIAYNSSGSYAGQGIYCTYSSLPSIGQSGGNTINYNDIGLYTYNGLTMTLATSNSFTGNYGYHIKAESNCTITAYNSFSPTQTSKFCATTGSTIYTNYGTITTCTPLPPSIAATHFDEVKSGVNSTKDSSEDLTVAKLFEIWNDYRTNKSKEDFIAYLNTVISAKLSTEVTAMAEFILAGYDENSKINTYKNLSKKYEGLPVTEIMLYELFVDSYLSGDLKEAEKQYKLLEKDYRYSELTTDAKRFLG
ncbi:MAG: hypothetical protein F9K45_02970, partial [Melioribacteraceae bacterium]